MLFVLRKKKLYSANRLILQFLDEKDVEKYASKTGYIQEDFLFPLNLILISSYSKSDDTCCYQKVSIYNNNQKVHLIQSIDQTATAIYAEDFINKQNIQQDWILSVSELNQLLKIK